MALALADRDELSTHVVHDERAAAFVALGLGLSGVPAALLCTSGTAAANFLPAVVEAGLSDVPLLVLTADRPPELRDVGAAQTIDQTGLYGSAVRWFHDPGIADADAMGSWRSLGRRAWAHTLGPRPGPVHLNLPFREPLLGTAGSLPAATPFTTPTIAYAADVAPLAALDRARGVIVAGGRSGVAPDVIATLAEATGWPVLADPTSGATALTSAVTYGDALVRHAGFASAQTPELIVRFGRPPASRVVNEWLAGSGAPVVQVGGPGVVDPDHHVVVALTADAAAATIGVWSGSSDGAWATRWRDAQANAERAVTELLASESSLTEPAVARAIADTLDDDADLVVASSMPVRDLEWYGGRGARAHANRGANGIDGVVSTALGRALTGRTVVALVGDVAFLHDGGALTALRSREVDLRIVVIDNDGGGIFSFLPQATGLDAERFELLYGTPHGTDLDALARAHGLDTATVTTIDALAARLALAGPTVTVVRTERAANVDVHRRLNAAVAAALS